MTVPQAASGCCNESQGKRVGGGDMRVSGAALACMQVLWSRGESLGAVDFAALQPFCCACLGLWKADCLDSRSCFKTAHALYVSVAPLLLRVVVVWALFGSESGSLWQPCLLILFGQGSYRWVALE